MSNQDYCVETRVINGFRYYRLCYWNRAGADRAEIIASSFEQLKKKAGRIGYRIMRP